MCSTADPCLLCKREGPMPWVLQLLFWGRLTGKTALTPSASDAGFGFVTSLASYPACHAVWWAVLPVEPGAGPQPSRGVISPSLRSLTPSGWLPATRVLCGAGSELGAGAGGPPRVGVITKQLLANVLDVIQDIPSMSSVGQVYTQLLRGSCSPS